MAWTLTAASLPGAREFWVTPRLAEAMAGESCLAMPPAVVGHAPPSVVFQFGTDTAFLGWEGAMDWLAAAPDRAAWIARDAIPEGMAVPPRATRRHRSGRNRLHQRTPRASAALRVAGCPRAGRALRRIGRSRPPPPKPIAKKHGGPRFPPGRRSRFLAPDRSPGRLFGDADQNRSFSITLVQAATKSCTNFSCASSWA